MNRIMNAEHEPEYSLKRAHTRKPKHHNEIPGKANANKHKSKGKGKT